MSELRMDRDPVNKITRAKKIFHVPRVELLKIPMGGVISRDDIGATDVCYRQNPSWGLRLGGSTSTFGSKHLMIERG